MNYIKPVSVKNYNPLPVSVNKDQRNAPWTGKNRAVKTTPKDNPVFNALYYKPISGNGSQGSVTPVSSDEDILLPGPTRFEPHDSGRHDYYIYTSELAEISQDVIDHAGEDVIAIEVHNKEEFLEALNNLPADVDDVVILAHGSPTHLRVGDDDVNAFDLRSNIDLPEDVDIDEMVLLSCDTAGGWDDPGDENDMAEVFYMTFRPDTLIASDGNMIGRQFIWATIPNYWGLAA